MEHSHHSMPKATGFHLKLKEGTQALHDQAESGNFQERMVSGELARFEFSRFLTQMKHIHEDLDPCLEEAASTDNRVSEIFNTTHKRLHRIEQDLIDLGTDSTDDPLPSTLKFKSYIKEKLHEAPYSLIGILYVKEGATNGNKFIAKKLRETMGLDHDKAMGYLDPHGKDQRKCWNKFKETLNELNLDESEEQNCVKVAQDTFQMFMDVSREVSELSPVTVD